MSEKHCKRCEDCIHHGTCYREGNRKAYTGDLDLTECKLYKSAADVVVLPCKVGDTVYYIKGGYYKKPQFCEVSRPCKVVEVSFKLQRNGSRVMRGFITDNGTRYNFDSIGKSVFLTKEEAEKALAERKTP